MGKNTPEASSTHPQQCCPVQGEFLTCYSPAYNAPAAVSLKREAPSITGFIDGSFIYWCAEEEGLAIATTNVLNSQTSYFTTNTQTLFQSFAYEPGFKIGAGIVGYHDWVIHAEYTWYRGKTSADTGAPLSGTAPIAATSSPLSGTATWDIGNWFLQDAPSQTVASVWRLGLDLIDLIAGRPFYEGRYLVINPFAGLRSALIRQSLTVNATETPILGDLPPQPIQSRNQSNSWSIGPRGGLDAQCLLPAGFNLQANFGVSLLYTRYTSITHSEDVASTTYNPGPYTVSYSDYNCLRPELDLGLGLGWGKYLYNGKYHIDFSADYDFMIFWAQNMVRKLVDDTLSGIGLSAADLYLHGLTFTGRFDF